MHTSFQDAEGDQSKGFHPFPNIRAGKVCVVGVLPHRWSSLVCVLDSPRQQCANRGHLGVRLSPSAIHCCLPLDSFTPPPFFVLFSFSLKATPAFQICALLSGSSPCSVSPNGKQNSRKKKLPPLVALRATYNAEPLSKLLSFPLPPSFPATVGEELSHFLSFSSPCLALPLPLTI